MLAGPGTGKSTVTAHAFALLKWQGMNVEMATEYAKDKVWERSAHILANQDYVYAKQYKRIKQLEGQVDIVLTDGPLLHSLVYGTDPDLLRLVEARHREFHNLNIFLRRTKKYNPSGRTQTEDEAKQLDKVILDTLESYKIPFVKIEASQSNMPLIVETILSYKNTLEDECTTNSLLPS